jgi:hypothetical protein
MNVLVQMANKMGDIYIYIQKADFGTPQGGRRMWEDNIKLK